MGKIVGNLKSYKHIVVVLMIILCIQAYCDLALPGYTQDIIDVGIQNKGISHVVPKKIVEKEFKAATIFMNSKEKEKWENIYKKDGNIYLLREKKEEELEKLDETYLVPLVLRFQMEKQQNGENVKLTPEIISQMRGKLNKVVDSTGEKTLKSMGIAYAVQTHKIAGVNVGKVQKIYLWTQGGKMFVMALIMFIAAALASFVASKVGASIGKDLRSRLFAKVMSFSEGDIGKFSVASLITRTTNDVQQIQMVTTMMLRMVLYAPILGIWGIVKVAQTGADMGYIIALAVLLIIAFVALLFAVTLPKFKIMQDLVDGLNRIAREILTGLSVVRAFGREEEEEKRFDTANRKLQRTQLFTNRVMTLIQPTMQFFMFALIVFITWVSAKRIDDGNLQVGAMTAFITYSMMIVMSFLIITVMSIIIPRAGVAAERIDEVLKTESSIVEYEKAEEVKFPQGIVEFSHVDFAFSDAEKNALTDISFVAKPGKTTAIIGSTGSGKSSLVKLIPRFYDITGGSLKIDGVEIKNRKLKELRDEIGYVHQNGVLFSGTIASNIAFGNKNLSKESIEEAGTIAQANEFVLTKEYGYDSDISQGGSNVSGGQKQRLAIARAIAKHPKILIFDDSFSALDMKTDVTLRKELKKSLKDVTVIIVAQRISTIVDADQILVLDQGTIVGKGTHNELMKNCVVYRQIAESQLSEKELEGFNE